MRRLRKLRAVIAVGFVVAIVVALAVPAGAVTTIQNFRDINSPLDSCAFTQGVVTNSYSPGVGWLQSFQGESVWFVNDAGCTFAGGPQKSMTANTMRYQLAFQCSLDNGTTGWTAQWSPIVYNAAGVGHASWNSGSSASNVCAFSGANYNQVSRVLVYGGYLIGSTWFNTMHVGAWTAS